MDSKPLTTREVETQERILRGLKASKDSFIKRYGKNAEKIMYAIATKRAKAENENNQKQRIREIIKQTLK